MRQRSLLWAIILALSAIVAGARAQRFYLPEDLSFTGSQYIWESRALFELSDPDMWLYCEAGYAPALQYLPPFSELRHLLHHACRSYARWGYHGMIGYRVLTDYGYYFLSPLCDPIFLGYSIIDDWLGRPLRILYRTYADLSYLHFRVRAFDNIWRYHRFYDYYPRYGHRHYGWYDNHHCYARPPRPNYAPPRHNPVTSRNYANGRSGYDNRNSLQAGSGRNSGHITSSSNVTRLNATRSSSTALSGRSSGRSSSTTRSYSSVTSGNSGRSSVTRSSSVVAPLTRSSRGSTSSSAAYSSGRSFRSSGPSSSYRGSSMSTRSSSSSFGRGSTSNFSRSSSGSFSTRSSGASFSPSRQSGYSGRSSGNVGSNRGSVGRR